VDDMIYMESSSTDAGTVQITVSLSTGDGPGPGHHQREQPRPERHVQPAPGRAQPGVNVEARSTSILQVVALSSKSGDMDTLDISNYALMNVIDELVRHAGCG